MKNFKTKSVKHIPREENVRANALSKLANGKENEQLSLVVRQVLTKTTIEVLSIEATPEEED